MAVPATVESVGEYAFSRCRSLKSISLPDNIETLSNGIFWDDSVLTDVKYSKTLSVIGENAFLDCINLGHVLLPESVIGIEKSAFEGCKSLAGIDCLVPEHIAIDTTVFAGVDKSKCTLHVLPASASAYKAADVWKDFLIAGDYTAVDELNVNAKTVASRTYYDLQGRQSHTPVPGTVNIVKTAYTDGTTSTAKQLVK